MLTSGKIFALLAGASIGAVLGVLLAPVKGSETRKRLLGKFDKTSDILENFMNTEITKPKTGKTGKTDKV